MGRANTKIVPARHGAVLPFERLLAELSARFINLPAAEVDGAINEALQRIAELLGADRSQLIRFSEGGDARVTHSGAVKGFPVVAAKSIARAFPWLLQRARDGHPTGDPDVEALPAKAAVDRVSFGRIGGAGQPQHAATRRRARGRPDRIRFADASASGPTRSSNTSKYWPTCGRHALAHKRAQEALHDAATRFEQLVSGYLPHS